LVAFPPLLRWPSSFVQMFLSLCVPQRRRCWTPWTATPAQAAASKEAVGTRTTKIDPTGARPRKALVTVCPSTTKTAANRRCGKNQSMREQGTQQKGPYAKGRDFLCRCRPPLHLLCLSVVSGMQFFYCGIGIFFNCGIGCFPQSLTSRWCLFRRDTHARECHAQKAVVLTRKPKGRWRLRSSRERNITSTWRLKNATRTELTMLGAISDDADTAQRFCD